MIRLARLLFVLSCLVLGCSSGSALCKWLNEHNASVQITNDHGDAWNVCTNQVTAAGQAVEPNADAGSSSGFCNPSDPPSLDTDCSKCMKAACCAELTACAPDAECICHAGINTGVNCSGSPPDNYTALSTCYASSCPMCPRLP